MIPRQNPDPVRHYAIFLSYAHADNRETGRQWATWLHHLLEGYEVPIDLVGTKNSRGEWIPASLYPVFRDEEELPADSDLTVQIRQALENSDLLVVLCSPRAARSRYVRDEIRYFKELGKARQILAFIVEGEPNVAAGPGGSNPATRTQAECLPEPLRYGIYREDGKVDWSLEAQPPLAADVRPEGAAVQGWTTGAAYREALQGYGNLPREKDLKKRVEEYEKRLELAKLKVVAGSLGIPLGLLSARDKVAQLQKARQRARTLRRWLSAVGVLALLAVMAGAYSWVQRVESLKTASDTDFALAGLKMTDQDWQATLAYLAEALKNNPRNASAMALTVALIRNLPFPMTIMRHADSCNSASFSPDGRWVVTTSSNFVRIWDASTGRPVGQAIEQGDQVVSASFSPDGKRLVSVAGKVVQVWDTGTGRPVGQAIKHDDTVVSASFSPDGNRLLSAAGRVVRVWDAATGHPVSPPTVIADTVLAEPVLSVSFSPDGNRVLVTSGDDTQVWDTQTGGVIAKGIRHHSKIRFATFSPNGKWIVTASYDQTAQVWDAQTGQPAGLPLKHDDVVSSANFSPDGRWIVTASWDGSVRVWDTQTSQPLGQLMKHDNRVNYASFSADGLWVVSASLDKTVRIWDTQTGRPVSLPMNHDNSVTSAGFSPNGKWVLTLSGNTARVWDAHTGQPTSLPLIHGGNVPSAAFSPDGKRVATASGNIARVWDSQTGQAVGVPMKHADEVLFVSFSPDSKRVATASGDNTARIWDALTGEPLVTPLQNDNIAQSAVFSPDGQWLVTVAMQTVRLWNSRTGRPVGQPIQQAGVVWSATFSPDSQRILTAANDGTAQVWDAQTGHAVGSPMSHRGMVFAAGFSPDGRRVVTASIDNTARVWDAQTGQPAGPPLQHDYAVSAASFSPNGKWIVTASGDGTARIWDAQTGQPVGLPMKHGGSVKFAAFSPDSLWVLTVSGNVAQVWDSQTGQPLGVPLAHAGIISSASFSPDGRRVLTASGDGTARIWDVAIKDPGAPPWLATLAQISGGHRVNTEGGLEASPQDPYPVLQQLRTLSSDDDISRFGRWLAAEHSTRPISPLSSISVPKFVSALLEYNKPAFAQEAYRLDPGNPRVALSLAKFAKDRSEKLFLCRYALGRARIEGRAAEIEYVRSAAESIFPDLSEFASARGAALPTTGPDHPDLARQ